MTAFIDLVGQRFGRLVVKKRAKNSTEGRCCWLCKCDCGKYKIVQGKSLRSGHTKSCGCLQRETVGKQFRTHGMCNIPEYHAWLNMKARCYNPKRDDYEYYIGRGIIVCDRWRNSFTAFFEDMGKRPTQRHSIDRINNNGNYEPGNCKWSTREEQRANTRPASHGPAKQYWFRAWHKDMMCQYLSNNQHEFAKQHRLDSADISACLNGRYIQHKGWQFKRIENTL